MDIANRVEKTAYNEYQKLTELLRLQSGLFVEIGFTFKRIRDEKLFKYMGDGGFETWTRFLSQPEINVKPSTAYFFISIYEIFIQRLSISSDRVKEIPVSKIQKLLPIVRHREIAEAIEIVDNTVYLGAKDFQEEIDRLKGVVKKPNEIPSVMRCEVCDKWIIVAKKEEICQCPNT